MFPRTARGVGILLLVSIFLFTIHAVVVSSAFAAVTPTPTPTLSGTIGLQGTPAPQKWVKSDVVTELGKNSERARHLLFWVFSHPPVFSAPVLAQMWSVSRNVAYAFVIITIIMFAIGFTIAQRRGATFSGISFGGGNLGSIILKIAMVLLYITFSYIFVLLLIQFSEILMRFFIERVGGQDLFNIVFVSQNKEDNYRNFIGYWDANLDNLEMRNTSIFLIRLTSLTYNVMAIMLILRHVILWFLLIVSPFLALLMPFIFIRNTGWIWIGVFFQWIFYGPLFALFLAGITKIWALGIPYPFDFDRVKKMTGDAPYNQVVEQPVYPTSINILYGGPAQTLKFFNSANYVDTYAEYVIALVMLWTATFLPWLLLRIFRDYCCEILAQNQATLTQILDRMRGIGSPPPPPPTLGPTTTAGQAIDLPFRKAVEAPQAAFLSKLADLQKSQTRDIAQALNMSISSIQDVADYEINAARQNSLRTNLDYLHNPSVVSDHETRERYSTIRSELVNRAMHGDRLAEQVVAAADRQSNALLRPITGTRSSLTRSMTTPDVARRVGVSEAKVRSVLQSVPTMGHPSQQTIKNVATKEGVSETKVQEILSASRPALMVAQQPLRPTSVAGKAIPSVMPIKAVSGAPQVTVDDYEEVKSMWVKHYREAEVPISEKISNRQHWLETDVKKLTNVINLVASMDVKLKQKGVEEVGQLLPFLLLGGFSDTETLIYLKAKLAAASQVMTELKVTQKTQVSTKEDEEELIEVGKEGHQEKAMHAQEERSQTLPQQDKEGKQETGEKPSQTHDDAFSELISAEVEKGDKTKPEGAKDESELIDIAKDKDKLPPKTQEPQAAEVTKSPAQPLDEGVPGTQEQLDKQSQNQSNNASGTIKQSRNGNKS